MVQRVFFGFACGGGSVRHERARPAIFLSLPLGGKTPARCRRYDCIFCGCGRDLVVGLNSGRYSEAWSSVSAPASTRLPGAGICPATKPAARLLYGATLSFSSFSPDVVIRDSASA